MCLRGLSPPGFLSSQVCTRDHSYTIFSSPVRVRVRVRVRVHVRAHVRVRVRVHAPDLRWMLGCEVLGYSEVLGY